METTEQKSIGMELICLIQKETNALAYKDIKEQSDHLDNLESLIKTARLKIK